MSEELPPVAFVDGPTTIDNPVLAFFFDYWNAKRGARMMPARADMKLTEMKEYLGWVSLFEALPGFDDFRYRLIGSRVTQYFHADATGKTLRQSYADAKAGRAFTERVLLLFRETCEKHRPQRATGAGGPWRGRYYPDYDALYLPLSDDGETANMVMNIFTFNYTEFRKTGSISTLLNR